MELSRKAFKEAQKRRRSTFSFIRIGVVMLILVRCLWWYRVRTSIAYKQKRLFEYDFSKSTLLATFISKETGAFLKISNVSLCLLNSGKINEKQGRIKEVFWRSQNHEEWGYWDTNIYFGFLHAFLMMRTPGNIHLERTSE